MGLDSRLQSISILIIVPGQQVQVCREATYILLCLPRALSWAGDVLLNHSNILEFWLVELGEAGLISSWVLEKLFRGL